MWLLSHALLLATMFVALRFLSGPLPGIGSALKLLTHWDGGPYAWVAEHGGYPPIVDPSFTKDPLSVYTAWPPGYPMVIWLVMHLLPGVSAASTAVLVSHLAALAMLIVLARLLHREVDAGIADRTLLFLIAFPSAFFFSVAYSESLFLLLAIGALYCARQGRWWWAGLLTAGAGATRVVGVLIGIALAYEYLRQRDWKIRRVRWDVLALGLVPAGLAGYMFYLWDRYGDPLVFLHAQAFWGRSGFSWPWNAVALALTFDDGADASVKLLDLTTVVLVIVLLVLGLVGPWRLERDQFWLWLAGAILFLFPLTTTSAQALLGMNRYGLVALPAFIVLAKMCRQPLAQRFYLFTTIPIQAALLVQFMRFEWAG